MSNTSAMAIAIHITDPQGTVTSINGKIGETLMAVATAKNINGIAADCGGLMSCATCHVFVQEPFASQLGAPGADELAMLAFTAVPRQPHSRLSCQITLSAEMNGLAVTLPASQY